jgi:PhnB protein
MTYSWHFDQAESFANHKPAAPETLFGRHQGNIMSIIPRPQGHHVLTPSALVSQPASVIKFLTTAFAAKVLDQYEGPDGSIMHAEILVGDSVVIIASHGETTETMPANLLFYVDDAAAVDRTFKKALKAGATAMSEPKTMPWGYHAACIRDVGGNRWSICTVVEEVSHDEVVKRMQSMPQN